MIKNKIGENAGKIYSVLNDNVELNIRKLKKATMLGGKEIYLALGWLAKEYKVLFWGDENDYSICLTEK